MISKRFNRCFFISKKAISPVVATALLLVVAVVAVVTFQGWFGNLESSIFSDVEIKSNSATDGTLIIERVVGDILYIINNIENNLSINDLEIDGNTCSLADNLSLGMNEVNVSDCVDSSSTSTPDIVLIADKQVVEKSVFLKNRDVSGGSSQILGETENKL
jgi:flagellin-like protein